MNNETLQELLLQALETELGGARIYKAALQCATNEGLREEWQKYEGQTREHAEALREACKALDVDPAKETPGRAVVRHIGRSLVEAIEMAKANAKPGEAQLVACECVMLAETKDHSNWHLLGEAAAKLKGEGASALRKTLDELEDEEDEHLYHTSGWCRELWLEALDLPAVLPPPEEEKDVKTAIGAARAAKARKGKARKRMA
jgi:rubrerythrin